MIVKYEKRGKYSTMLHNVTYNNYIIVKCLLKSIIARVIKYYLLSLLLTTSSLLNAM